MSKKLYTSLLAAGVLAVSVNAFASVSTDNLNVTANVGSYCTVTGGTLAFGTYISDSPTPVSANTTISATCSNNTQYIITLSTGSYSSDPTARQMRGTASGQNLMYLLTTNGSDYWSDSASAATANVGAQVGTNNPYSFTVYGSIPAGQPVPEDTYTDTVVITANFS